MIDVMAIASSSRPKIRLTMLSPLAPSVRSIRPDPSMKARDMPVTMAITMTLPMMLCTVRVSPKVMTVAMVPGPAVLGMASGMTAGFLPCVSRMALGRAMIMPQAMLATTSAPATLKASISILNRSRMYVPTKNDTTSVTATASVVWKATFRLASGESPAVAARNTGGKASIPMTAKSATTVVIKYSPPLMLMH